MSEQRESHALTCSPEELANLKAYAEAENRTKLHALRQRDEARVEASRYRRLYYQYINRTPPAFPWENPPGQPPEAG
jgi:hypothetical protein